MMVIKDDEKLGFDLFLNILIYKFSCGFSIVQKKRDSPARLGPLSAFGIFPP
jgi:hypothetical protein